MKSTKKYTVVNKFYRHFSTQFYCEKLRLNDSNFNASTFRYIVGCAYSDPNKPSVSSFTTASTNDSGVPFYDVIVIGGGHAGCESAAAAARCGAETLLITHKKDTIGAMSCNPSFGGIGKGHLIREIDALDGVCPRICDQSAIHYHALNQGRGPAVIGLRAQIDRKLYKKAMQEEILENTPRLKVIEASVEDFYIDERPMQEEKGTEKERKKREGELIHYNENRGNICGCILADGRTIRTSCLIITTGTFLGGRIYRGLECEEAGRLGDASSFGLSRTFARFGFKLSRLRTGTPPRLVSSTINFEPFIPILPDQQPILFSFLTQKVWLSPEKQLCTYLGRTNQRVKELVMNNLDENHPVMSSEWVNGPRYCPSLEAKVMRFGHLDHRMFLEPEGLDDPLIYPQGMSMSFKPEVQLEIMRSIPGLEKVELAYPGYLVEYDYVDPKQLRPSLETRIVDGLFLAGQINGTTGYEEAASQGIIAGINAALKAKWLTNNSGHSADEFYNPLIIDRTQAYIGVLVDDLTSLGVVEPYRMFTSRAENRMFLRPDNADMRLTELGYRVGAVSSTRYDRFSEFKRRLDQCRDRLCSLNKPMVNWLEIFPQLQAQASNLRNKQSRMVNGHQLLGKYDAFSLKMLNEKYPELFSDFVGDLDIEKRLRYEEMYSRFKELLDKMNERLHEDMAMELPKDLDYWGIKAIGMESRELLSEYRPPNLAAAARIPGITQSTLIQLMYYARLQNNRRK